VKKVSHATGTLLLALLVTALLHACSNATEPEEDPLGSADLAFAPSSIDLGEEREATVRMENRGTRAAGPIQLLPAAVTHDGGPVAGAQLQVTPHEIPTLNPGSAVDVTLSLLLDTSPPSGAYETSLDARVGGETTGTLGISFSVAPPPPPGLTDAIEITAGPEAPRQGDVVAYAAETRDSNGQVVNDTSLRWSVSPATAGVMTSDGRFVGYDPGAAKVIATASDLADTLDITVSARQPGRSDPRFSVVGRAPISDRFTSDLWVHGDFAYAGTWACRGSNCGNRLHTWNVSNPGAASLTHVVEVNARVVNDVKIRADGLMGVITHEASNDGQNGVTLLDLSDPARPLPITRFTAGLESGVHNVWVEGDYVYIVVDGLGNGMRILDISNPSEPAIVGSYYAGSSFLHDIYVRDGLAFLSHWNAGLVILDVGNGIAGGSPTNPVEVSRIATIGGQTHNAWYWPAAGYVFVGEEDFDTPGIMHVVDVRDLANPREVANFRVEGTTPHNFWLDEERAILYLAWYEKGIRALDVSGALMGDFNRQGREITSLLYSSGGSCPGTSGTCTWAPQLHDGLVYLSDMNTGIWILQPDL
jgi:hypothetical protein